MERRRIEIDLAARRRARADEAAEAELARDRRGLALRDMALRPFRRAARRLLFALSLQPAAAAERAAR